MQDDIVTLYSATQAASTRLDAAARTVASIRPGHENARATAAVARESIFTEAMLGAMHARFAALKEVAK